MSNWRRQNRNENGLIKLPVKLVERPGVDLACQRIQPSADRRKVVEINRFKDQREGIEAELRRSLSGPWR